MYRALFEFLGAILKRWNVYFLDGEFVTAVIAGVLFGYWAFVDPTAPNLLKARLSDILTVTSIVFGFVMATLVFYIQAQAQWSQRPAVRETAGRLIDSHVWTVVCLLGSILAICLVQFSPVGQLPANTEIQYAVSWGFLMFVITYPGFQLLNHALTIRWAFMRSQRLINDPPQAAQPVCPEKPVTPETPSNPVSSHRQITVG